MSGLVPPLYMGFRVCVGASMYPSFHARKLVEAVLTMTMKIIHLTGAATNP